METKPRALTRQSNSQGGNGRKLPTNWSDNAMNRLVSKADQIANRVVKIALTDEHPGQLAALKLCLDRLIPVQKATEQLTDRQVQINI